MAKTKKEKKTIVKSNLSADDFDDDFSEQLIKEINSEAKVKIAYSLAGNNCPTEISSYVSTGSDLLDYIVSNRENGGLAAGRLTEIVGEESTGKSLIAQHILANTQKQGGIAVYIDTENATSLELLAALNVDIKKLVYLQPGCVEEVFDSIEKIIKKVHTNRGNKTVTIVWDSVAATPSKEELEGDYDQSTIGLMARKISQGLRKVTQLVGSEKISLVFINQLKVKIGGSMYSDNMVTPGGKAIPYHASTRIRLYRNGFIENKAKETIGVGVRAKVIKNKIAVPFRTCEFKILFGKGVDDTEEKYNVLRESGEYKTIWDGKKCVVRVASGSWCTLTIKAEDSEEVLVEEKFRKDDVGPAVIYNEKYKDLVDSWLKSIMIKSFITSEDIDIDADSLMEMEALADEVM